MEVLDRLNALGNEVLARPAVREQLLVVNNLPMGGTREEFVREIAVEAGAAVGV